MVGNPRSSETSPLSASPPDTKRTCILVLGMHRSGTSALTRMINLLGADLPSDPMPKLAANERGFWESRELMGIHDDLLASDLSRWDDWRPFQAFPQSNEHQAISVNRLANWLEREFAASQLFAVKDPRICRFVPLWLETLRSFACQTRVVLPVRHPFEVAASLLARDGMPFQKACLLWLRHVLDAERSTRNIPRAWVHYDDLLKDWAAVATRVSQQLGLTWPRSLDEAAVEIQSFLSSELRHHQASPQELEFQSDAVGWVRRAYRAITSLIADGDADASGRELDQLLAEFDSACLAFGDLIHVEREDAAQQALANVAVVTRGEFDRRVAVLESQLASPDASVGGMVPEAPDHGDDATIAAVDALSALMTGQEEHAGRIGNDLATCQGRVDGLASVVSDKRAAISRLENELAAWTSYTEHVRGQLARQQALVDTLQEESRQFREVTDRMKETSAKRERFLSGQVTLLRNDLDTLRRSVDEMRRLGSDSGARIDGLQADLENVRKEVCAPRGWSLAGPMKQAKRTIRLGRDAVVGLVTLRWMRVSRHALRLPFYRKRLLSTRLFDSKWYLEQNPDVAQAGIDPLKHWLKHGVREGRNPNPLFDTNWYLERHPHLAESGQNPLIHYLRRGSSPGIDPSRHFDAARYLSEHPEVARSRQNPLVHYLRHRAGQRCDMFPEPPPFEPLVTVVVPNFNHAPFLRRRLDSIYSQTYRNFRVILLDDCSSDGSRDILDEYRAKYPDITTCDYNEKNSGGVFRQWRKAMQLACGSPLLWIAESDDSCDHDFLEKLVPFFRDEAVMLAYSRMQFVNQHGEPNSFTFEDHVSPHMDASKWSRDYVEAGHREVESALAIKNTIPNVSGVVFRPPAPNSALLEDESWLNMKVCGDWVFYLHLIAGGRVAYCARTTNYFCLHSANSSGKTHRQEVYYREHARVSEEVARLYDVSDRALGLARAATEKYFRTVTGGGAVEFGRLFDARKIARAKAERRPTIMISVFSFVTGGGEIIPIRLANELKRRGFPVVVHCFDHQKDEPGVRAMLRNDIPVVRANTNARILSMLEAVSPDVINTHHHSIQHRLLELTQAHPRAFDSILHIATLHGMFEGLPQQYLDTMLPEFVNTVDGWIYTADKNLAPFKNRGLLERASFAKLPNGMDTPVVRGITRAELGLESDAFVLCEASRAIPEKGWREAIEAVTLARQVCSRPIHLLLLGHGPVFDELSQQSLPPYVHLLGFTEDACSYYAMSDMAILPSTFSGESFPMSLVEALMVGKPAIASDVGDIRSMLTAESGVAGAVVPVEHGRVRVDRIAEAIVRFAEGRDEYEHAQRVARSLARRYDVRDVAERYLAIVAGTVKRSVQMARLRHRDPGSMKVLHPEDADIFDAGGQMEETPLREDGREAA